MEEVSQESNLTPSDARPKFYALSDESLARSLQDEEYTSVGERNRQLRQRMKNQVSLVKEDEELASQLNSLDVSGAKQDLALQEKVATEEQDKELAQLLHRQESVQSKETEDERIAREMQDAEYAAYMQLKEKRKVELRMQKMEQQRQLEAQKTQQLLEGEQRQLQELERQRLEGELKTRRLLEEEKRQLDERERQRQQPQQSQLAKSASAADVPDEELARRMQQAEVLQYRHALQSRAASAAALQQQQPVTPGSATHVALPNPGPPQTAQGGASGHPANVRQQSMPTIPTQQHIPAGQETQSLQTTTGAVQGRMAIRKRAMSDGRSAQTGHQQQQQQQQQQTQPPLQEAPRTPTTAAAAGTPSPGTVARGLAATQEEEDLKLVPKMGKRRVTKKQK